MANLDELYISMKTHPDTAPVMEKLGLVEPVDEFSRALVLMRDCFSPSGTARTLAREKLNRMLASRVALMKVFETSVVQAARAKGETPKTFAEAMAVLTSDEMQVLRNSYRTQMDELMCRPLE